MRPRHVRNIFISVILLTFAVTGMYMLSLYKDKNTNLTTSVTSIPSAQQLPVQNIAQAQDKTRTVSSSDGIKLLTMKTKQEGTQTTYSFYATSSAEPFFTQTLAENYTFGIPDNAWSPGEKYVFLEKNGGGVKTDLVFHPDGSAFSEGQPYLDVGAFFNTKQIPYNFAGATGWADPALLIVETTKTDGTTGPSFWFELPSGLFIQLAAHQ